MPDYSPTHKPGQDITLTASTPILGGQLLTVSGGSVAPTGGAGPTWAGVARRDAAAGEHVVVCRGGVQKIVASGAVTATDRVVGAAAGRVATGATANSVGTALTTGVEGDTVLVLMDR